MDQEKKKQETKNIVPPRTPPAFRPLRRDPGMEAALARVPELYPAPSLYQRRRG